MIISTIDDLSQHSDKHPGLVKACDFLARPDLDSLAEGKHPIDGENVFALIETSAGKGKEKARLEAHREYIDVQFCLSGQDIIGISPLSFCEDVDEEYDRKKDIIFFSGQPKTWIVIGSRQCAVFFPEDCHAPLSCSGRVKKAVIKIRVSIT